MNFDAKGRLWVASSEAYPQILPGEMAADKVLVLEDTDNDGKAGQVNRPLPRNLLIPTGIEPGGRWGFMLLKSTELLHLRDTKWRWQGRQDPCGDVRIRHRGYASHFCTHCAGASMDVCTFNQSIYIRTHMETPHEVFAPRERRRVGDCGPRHSRLRFFLRGFCNPWGHHYDYVRPILCH